MNEFINIEHKLVKPFVVKQVSYLEKNKAKIRNKYFSRDMSGHNIDPTYFWIFVFILILSVAKCLFWFCVWKKARLARNQRVGNVSVFTIHGHENLEGANSAGLASLDQKPPPYSSLENCAAPPPYGSSLVNK